MALTGIAPDSQSRTVARGTPSGEEMAGCRGPATRELNGGRHGQTRVHLIPALMRLRGLEPPSP